MGEGGSDQTNYYPYLIHWMSTNVLPQPECQLRKKAWHEDYEEVTRAMQEQGRYGEWKVYLCN